MIRDGDRGQPTAAGQVEDLRRRIGAVAVRRVEVQVGTAGVAAGRGPLTESGEGLAARHAQAPVLVFWSRRSSTPLMKAGESAEP